MKQLQNLKTVAAIVPVSINGGSATATTIDTKGFSYMKITFALGVVGANMTALKLQESEVSGSGYVDTTNGGFAVAPQTTDANGIFCWYVNLQTHKRYFQIVATAGAGATLVSATADLGEANQVPITVANRGVNQQIIL